MVILSKTVLSAVICLSRLISEVSSVIDYDALERRVEEIPDHNFLITFRKTRLAKKRYKYAATFESLFVDIPLLKKIMNDPNNS